MTTIDFTQALKDAKSASFDALPNGDYDIEVVAADAVMSGNGKPMLKVKMKVISGPHTNRPIINNFVLSLDNATAVAIFFRHMRCFGLTEEFFASLGANGSLEPVAQALPTRRARLSLGQREWNGEMRNDVKGVKPYTGAPTAGGVPGPMPSSGPIAGPGMAAAPSPLPTTPAPAPAPVAPTTPATAATPIAPPAPVAPPAPTPAPAAAEPAHQPESPAAAATEPATQVEAPTEVAAATPPPPTPPI